MSISSPFFSTSYENVVTTLSGIKFFSTKSVQIAKAAINGKALSLNLIQQFQIELSVMMEMSCFCFVQHESHEPPVTFGICCPIYWVVEVKSQLTLV